MKKRLVILTGAGISAESGIKTFRDAGGLWEGYDIMEVASPEGWAKDPITVLEFYNQRRKNVREVVPNDAHKFLAELEHDFHVEIITQNIDDLHERGGSSRVLHLHGEIKYARSSKDESLLYPLGDEDIAWGDKCELGSQLRPHVVWFGESVPMIEKASEVAAQADVFCVIGTSLQVYPAAGLVQYCKTGTPIVLVDPKADELPNYRGVEKIQSTAVKAIPALKESLKKWL